MIRRRQSRTRVQSSSALTAACVELLENKQLLSGVNSADNPGRTITISDPSVSFDDQIWIEEVHVVDDAIWVLTDVRPAERASIWSGFGPLPSPPDIGQLIPFVNTDETPPPTEVSASITVDVPADLPVIEFRIDGAEGGQAISVDGIADFAERLDGQESEFVYSRVDRELALWREEIRHEMEVQADVLYGDSFGQETGRDEYWWFPTFPNDDTSFVTRVLIADAAEVSDTNVQVGGVDEADIVETDGEYIYTLSAGQLVVVSAATAEAESTVVSRTQLGASQNLAMFLFEGRLTIISKDYHTSYQSPIRRRGLAWDLAAPTSTRTVITVLDVSDPTAPALQQETVVDGIYQNARAIGSQVYVVVNNNQGIPYLPSLSTIRNSGSSTGYRFESRAEYFERIERIASELTPPSAYRRSETPDGESTLQRLGWLDGASDQVVAARAQLTTVLQFDSSTSDSMPVDNISVRTARYSSAQVYANADSLYLITNEQPSAELDGNLIRLANTNSISAINKIDISGQKMAFEGRGAVPGIVESQFSIDEHNGYLRVVTTTDQWGPESKNHIFVLEDVGEELTVVGSIEDLAPTERVYSARFDGDRAWVVTFRRIDPVFSIDLSDPTNPQVTGELKIPGFSEHLQLIDENHLLAIGRAATDEGRVQGLQVSIFDVSDMTAPQLIHQRLLDDSENGWSNSAALHDHHAFNYLADEGLLLIPYQDRNSNGLMALSIDVENGIKIVGEATSNGSRNVLRSVQIGDFLYAVSYNSVSVISANDPGTVLYDVNFGDHPQAPHDHRELLLEHFEDLRDRLDVREYLQENGDRIRQVEFGDLAGIVNQGIDELLEFEFSVTDIETGVELIRDISDGPWLSLQEDGQDLLEEGTYEFLVRTRSRLLDNPEWSEWIREQVISIGDERPEMLSDETLPELASVLQWSEIADQVRSRIDDGVETFELNPVDHYEVWVTDANIGEMVLWDREVQGTELNLESFAPGQYYSWFRAILEDGTEAAWSARNNFEIQGRALGLLNDFVSTADALPDFAWEEIDGATGFEVQITTPDGSQTVYTATDIPEARHEITQGLQAGTYTLRVRADLASGVNTEWAETQFTILDRPAVLINNRRLDLVGADGVVEADGSEAIEIWVNKADSYERVFHSVEWTDIENVDLVEAFGLTNEVGEYDIWMRLLGEQNSKWSTRQTFEVFHDAINIAPPSEFGVGDIQEFTWETAPLVESYELFVKQTGTPGAFLHETGIIGDGIQLAVPLPEGEYEYWLRGELVNGYTPWTEGFDLTVLESVVAPALREVGNTIQWDAPSAAINHLWVNRVDEQGRLLEARVAHVRQLADNSFDLSGLGEGHYAAWVQTSVETANGLVSSDWSDRLNFEVPVQFDVTDVWPDNLIDDVIGDLIGSLGIF